MQKLTKTLSALLMALVMSIFFSGTALAQEEEEADDRFSFNVSLNSDQFFGFYPFFQGAYAVNDGVDFTFYGICGRAALAVAGATGQSLA